MQKQNESSGRWEKYRIRVKVGAAYGSDVDQVCDVLKSIADESDNVCKDFEPRVRMRFGASSLILNCFVGLRSLF